MDDDQKLQMTEWKSVMEHCLCPVKTMDALPEFFPLNSSARSRVEAKLPLKHDAVSVMIEELMNTQGSFHRFAEEVRRDHEWLYPLITGKVDADDIPNHMIKIDHSKYVNKFLSLMLPRINEVIDANEISRRLRAKGFLTQEDDERIEAKVDNSGNTDGVRMLLSILVRKPLSWVKEFKKIMHEQNYDLEILDEMPDDPETFRQMSCSTYCSEMSYEDLTGPSSIWSNSGAESPIVEKDIVFEGVEQDDAAWRKPLVQETFPLTHTPSRSNNIIPKEARYNTPLARSRQPVRGEASLSPQQKDVALRPIDGENVIICASDGSDRSRLIVHIIQSRFPHILDSMDRKIVLTGDKIMTQHDIIKEWFQSNQWGVAQYDERSEQKFSDLLTSHQVVISTPKQLMSWLSSESDVGRITELDMIVMDECDKVFQNGPCKDVMRRYHEVKITRQTQNLPQMIGLFSNIGRISKLTKALDQVKNLCAILDAKGGILMQEGPVNAKSPLRGSKSGLNKQSKTKDQHYISDPFTLHLCETMDKIISMLYTPAHCRQMNLPARPNKLCKGSVEYSDWCTSLEESGDSNAGPQQKVIKKYAKILRALSSALFIKGRCTAEDSFAILKERHQEICGGGKAAVPEKSLCREFTDAIENLQHCVSDPRAANSALLGIEKELVASFRKKKSTVAILLVNDSQFIAHIQNWLMSTQALKSFNIECFREKTALSNSTSTAKSRAARILIGHYSHANPADVACDLLICYDCECPVISKSQGKAKSPTIKTFKSTCLVADEKVKIEGSLLAETAAKIVRDNQKNNREAYERDLERRQRVFLSS